MVFGDERLRETARHYKRELLGRMFRAAAAAADKDGTRELSAAVYASNIVGLGFGAREDSGPGQDGLSLRVYVRAKLPNRALPTSERVPQSVNGVPTDVIVVGHLAALARPTSCGVSIGHPAIAAGTLGCVVRRAATNDPGRFILSNNHVLADSNNASLGDPILEPGLIDGGNHRNPIARLTDFHPIDFTGNPNHIDAAIAEIRRPSDVRPDVLVIGTIEQPPIPAALYQSVRKHGRTTLHTVGVIMDLAADVWPYYGTQRAYFEDQLAITGAGMTFSDRGDSGSLVMDAVTRQPVGLLFAGGLGTTFANPIAPVLRRFGVEIM